MGSVISRDMKKLLLWPEFVTGLEQMQKVVDEKEAAGDTSPTVYRIELEPPHHWHGQNFIVLTHNPKQNQSMTFRA